MKNEPIVFRMYADILFDRPIDKEKHYISPGGYSMVFNGKTIDFDFDDYEGSIDKDDPRILHTMQKNPSYDEFEDLENLSSEDLRKLESIDEFFIYTGECDEPEINPIRILGLAFENFGSWGTNDMDEEIDYSNTDIVKKYRFEV